MSKEIKNASKLQYYDANNKHRRSDAHLYASSASRIVNSQSNETRRVKSGNNNYEAAKTDINFNNGYVVFKITVFLSNSLHDR